MLPICVLRADARRLSWGLLLALLFFAGCVAWGLREIWRDTQRGTLRGRDVRSGLPRRDSAVADRKADAALDVSRYQLVVDTVVDRSNRQERATTRYRRGRAELVAAIDSPTAQSLPPLVGKLLTLADAAADEGDSLRLVALRAIGAADEALASQSAVVGAQDTAVAARDTVIDVVVAQLEADDGPRCGTRCKVVAVGAGGYAAVKLTPRLLRWLGRRFLRS